jgi:hypothetical protein
VRSLRHVQCARILKTWRERRRRLSRAERDKKDGGRFYCKRPPSFA